MQIMRCGIHGFHETLGIDVDELHMYWALDDDEETARQTAYQVVLKTDSDFETTHNVVWDSGKV